MNDFSPKESLRLILNKTSFISFRKEFFFELSNELRNKYGGFPLKIKNKEILLKENTLSFQTDISIKLPSYFIFKRIILFNQIKKYL